MYSIKYCVSVLCLVSGEHICNQYILHEVIHVLASAGTSCLRHWDNLIFHTRYALSLVYLMWMDCQKERHAGIYNILTVYKTWYIELLLLTKLMVHVYKYFTIKPPFMIKAGRWLHQLSLTTLAWYPSSFHLL